MVYSGSLRVWPVRMRTTRSSGVMRPFADEFFEAGEGGGGGGLAADAFGADLGLGEGDLVLGGLLGPAAGGVDGVNGLAEGGGIADADGGGAGVGDDGGDVGAVVFLHGAEEGVGAFGLDDGDLWGRGR